MAEDLIPSVQTGQGPAARGGYNAAGPDYRQVQQPEQGIQPYHLHGSTGEEAAALARSFKEFENIGTAIQGKLNEKAGAQAGAQAGLDPNFKPQTGLQSITAYGSAYDAAAHVSYVNNTHAQMENAFSKAEQDNAGDPVAFQTVAEGAAKGIIDNAPAMYKPELTNAASLRMQAGITRTREQRIVSERSDALESHLSTIDSRIDSALQTASTLPHDQQAAVLQQTLAGNRTQLDALVQSRAITPAHSAIMQEEFQKRMTAAVQKQYTTNTVNHMMDVARAGNVDGADAALKQYVSDPRNSDTDKEAVTKEYFEQADKYHQLQSRVHANDIAAVGQQLVQGTGEAPGQGAYGKNIEGRIHQLYKIGALTPEQLHSFMDQSMKNQVDSIDDQSGILAVDAAVHGTGPKLDPEGKGVQKAADRYFLTQVAGSNVPPLSDMWTAGASSFAKQTNIIPKSVQSQLRIGLISGDPTMAVRAAASAERIRAANPQVDPYAADPRSAALADEINSNLHAGMAPQAAYQKAIGVVDRPKDQKEAIKQSYEAIIKKDPKGNNKVLQSAMDDAAGTPWYSHGPPADMALQAEYGRLVNTYYGFNQDIDKARALAAKQVQVTWGVSQMNGHPELVKYPPERLGVTPELLRSDIAAHVKAEGYTGDPAQVRLVANAQYTDASGGRTWSVQHVDPKSGVPDTLLGLDNQPLVYRIPQGPSFAEAQQKLRQQKLEAARAERAANRATAPEQIPGEKDLADFYLKDPAGQAAMRH